MPAKQYRVGLIGCGLISQIHANGVRLVGDCNLVALADPYEPNLQEAGKAYGVSRLYQDHRTMLAEERLDIVIVSTQTPHHAPLVIDAAQAGVRGIICEKPIAMDLAEADAMIAACDAAGTRLAINHQTRMVASTYAAERLIQDGAIGELRLARMLDKGGRPAGISILEMGTHVLDLLMLYTGAPAWVSGYLSAGAPRPDGQRDPDGDQHPATIADIQHSQSAWADRDCGLVLGDRCSATIAFAPRAGWHHGLTATFESFFQGDPIGKGQGEQPTWKTSVELIGTGGVLAISGSTADLFLHRGPWTPPGRFEKIDAPPAPEPFPYGQQQSAFVRELIDAIEGNREHRCSGRAGRWALEIIMGIYESHRAGGARVELPLATRDHPLDRWLRESGLPIPARPETGPRAFRLRQPIATGQRQS